MSGVTKFVCFPLQDFCNVHDKRGRQREFYKMPFNKPREQVRAKAFRQYAFGQCPFFEHLPFERALPAAALEFVAVSVSFSLFSSLSLREVMLVE